MLAEIAQAMGPRRESPKDMDEPGAMMRMTDAGHAFS
jgi:hypothetical protein